MQRQGVPALGGGGEWGVEGGKLGWVGPSSYPRWKILTKLEAKLLYDLIMSVTVDILSRLEPHEIPHVLISANIQMCGNSGG